MASNNVYSYANQRLNEEGLGRGRKKDDRRGFIVF